MSLIYPSQLRQLDCILSAACKKQQRCWCCSSSNICIKVECTPSIDALAHVLLFICRLLLAARLNGSCGARWADWFDAERERGSDRRPHTSLIKLDSADRNSTGQFSSECRCCWTESLQKLLEATAAYDLSRFFLSRKNSSYDSCRKPFARYNFYVWCAAVIKLPWLYLLSRKPSQQLKLCT